MMSPELSRPVRLDTLSTEPRTLAIVAEPHELEALAGRFGLMEIASLRADPALTRRGVEAVARGRLEAEVTQSCVATGEPVAQRVDAPFQILFRPQPEPDRPDEEVELSESELDVVFYEGASIDVGEAVAETLLLNLDPYPRSPYAEAALKAAGVKSEEEARAESSPFAALGSLKDKLKP